MLGEGGREPASQINVCPSSAVHRHGLKGVVVVVVQLEFQQSFLFMFLDVPQIQFNSEYRTFQLYADGYGCGG